MDINFKSALKEKFPQWELLDEYLKIIDKYKLNTHIKSKTEAHHILPKCAFPEYSDFKIHPWNRVYLPIYQHIYVHYLLCSTRRFGLLNAFQRMTSVNSSQFKKLSDSEKDFTIKLWADKREQWINQDTLRKRKSFMYSNFDFWYNDWISRDMPRYRRYWGILVEENNPEILGTHKNCLIAAVKDFCIRYSKENNLSIEEVLNIQKLKQSSEKALKAKGKTLSKTARRNQLKWNYEKELRELWINNNKPKYVNFRKLAVSLGYPDENYINMIKRFENGL